MKLVMQNMNIDQYLPPSLLTLLCYRTNNSPECNLGKLYPFLADNLIRYKIKQIPNINIL